MKLVYDSVRTAKVQLVIQPGTELEVPEDVAKQLMEANAHFVPVDGSSVDAPETSESDEGQEAQADAPAETAEVDAQEPPLPDEGERQEPAKKSRGKRS